MKSREWGLRGILITDYDIPEERTKLDSDFTKDLMIDSLERFAFIADIEKYFHVGFTDDEIHELHTLREVLTLLDKYLGKEAR